MKQKRRMTEPLILILFEVLFLSTNPHKEDRFLMKLLPFFLIYVGIGIYSQRSTQNKEKPKPKLLSWRFVVFFGNLAYFVYAALIDKRGAIDVMDYLRDHSDSIKGLSLLTECHRTPYYSFLHKYNFFLQHS